MPAAAEPVGGVLVALGLREGYDPAAPAHAPDEVAAHLRAAAATGWSCRPARLASARHLDGTVRWYEEDGILVRPYPGVLRLFTVGGERPDPPRRHDSSALATVGFSSGMCCKRPHGRSADTVVSFIDQQRLGLVAESATAVANRPRRGDRRLRARGVSRPVAWVAVREADTACIGGGSAGWGPSP
ncbi:hypothetical protein AB0E96_19470 [Kitasatospora sp. NPDC036755]|uniref:hypothetical protein n=1 Tax=Kitasatospora sp. NPDC036755 TaxID=3154600 RepID=UPI0033DDE670